MYFLVRRNPLGGLLCMNSEYPPDVLSILSEDEAIEAYCFGELEDPSGILDGIVAEMEDESAETH